MLKIRSKWKITPFYSENLGKKGLRSYNNIFYQRKMIKVTLALSSSICQATRNVKNLWRALIFAVLY